MGKWKLNALWLRHVCPGGAVTASQVRTSHDPTHRGPVLRIAEMYREAGQRNPAVENFRAAAVWRPIAKHRRPAPHDPGNTGSTFYTAQCGNYNAATNPNGYISGALLLANVTQHESGTPGHYGQYVQAQGSATNNLGILAEATVTPSGTDFNQTLNKTLSDAITRIDNATNSEAALCNGDASRVPPACTFNGYVNFSPYAACH